MLQSKSKMNIERTLKLMVLLLWYFDGASFMAVYQNNVSERHACEPYSCTTFPDGNIITVAMCEVMEVEEFSCQPCDTGTNYSDFCATFQKESKINGRRSYPSASVNMPKECPVPDVMYTYDLECELSSETVECVGTCDPMYSYPEGMTRNYTCNLKKDKWEPTYFEECEAVSTTGGPDIEYATVSNMPDDFDNSSPSPSFSIINYSDASVTSSSSDTLDGSSPSKIFEVQSISNPINTLNGSIDSTAVQDDTFPPMSFAEDKPSSNEGDTESSVPEGEQQHTQKDSFPPDQGVPSLSSEDESKAGTEDHPSSDQEDTGSSVSEGEQPHTQEHFFLFLPDQGVTSPSSEDESDVEDKPSSDQGDTVPEEEQQHTQENSFPPDQGVPSPSSEGESKAGTEDKPSSEKENTSLKSEQPSTQKDASSSDQEDTVEPGGEFTSPSSENKKSVRTFVFTLKSFPPKTDGSESPGASAGQIFTPYYSRLLALSLPIEPIHIG